MACILPKGAEEFITQASKRSNATPPGASGRVYGFVYSGLDLGATLSPVLIGVLLDHGSPRMVFVFIAAALLVAVSTVVQVRRRPAARMSGASAAD